MEASKNVVGSKRLQATADLEDLAALVPETIKVLREGVATDYLTNGYAHVYHLRRRLSKIVATLGAGSPSDPFTE